MTEVTGGSPGPASEDSRIDAAPSPWYVYVLRSQARPVTYVGIAKDVEARLAQHNGETKGGAKSTRAARPWTVARTLGPYPTRGEAQAREYAVKQLPPEERLIGRGASDARP